MSRIPRFPDNPFADGGEVVSLTRRPKITVSLILYKGDKFENKIIGIVRFEVFNAFPMKIHILRDGMCC
jgi:hypothetical protein